MKTDMEMLCGPVLIVLIQSCLLGALAEDKHTGKTYDSYTLLTFRHRASCILGQAFHYSPENAFYIFNQQIYLII